MNILTKEWMTAYNCLRIMLIKWAAAHWRKPSNTRTRNLKPPSGMRIAAPQPQSLFQSAAAYGSRQKHDGGGQWRLSRTQRSRDWRIDGNQRQPMGPQSFFNHQ